jgi:hypothetical protein
MAWSIDARIPVTLLPDAAALPGAMASGRPAALLAEGAAPEPAAAPVTGTFAPEATLHPAACACCAGRSPAAQALDRLFQDRVRGRVAWFDRVLVVTTTLQGRDELARALALDPLTTARFRRAPE